MAVDKMRSREIRTSHKPHELEIAGSTPASSTIEPWAELPELIEEEVFVPKLPVFRNTVNEILDPRDAIVIKMLYLCAARVSEIITKVSPSEIKHKKTKPYGLHLTWNLDDYKKEKVLLVKFAVAKRIRKLRRDRKEVRALVYKICALPCSPEYEPWTLDLLKWLEKGRQLNFALTRQTVWKIVKKNLVVLDFSIHTHSLRHYRISHLVEHYGFDPYDITAYSGWTFKTTFGGMGMGSGQLDTYAHIAWRKYFPKLLKKI